jgi:hypothetical protein
MRVQTSSLIPNQVPEFVRADYPTFVAFVEAYYEYLDNQGVNLANLRDLDTTIDSFIQYFKKELAVNLPKEITVDERFLLQHIKDQYLAKGSAGSYKLLFKLLYDKNVQLTYPGKQMLRASDGKWQQDLSIFVKVTIGTPDVIDGKLVDVVKPNRTFKLLIDKRQYVEVEIERVVAISDDTFEFFIDRKYFGDIAVGDQIRYKEEFVGTIVSTTSTAQISQSGTGFKAGQLFELKNGSGVRSILKITRVSSIGAILSSEFIKYGIGYETDFSITINSTNDYYTNTNDLLLTTVTISPGALAITDATRGFSEQGYINRVDYAYDGTAPSLSMYWDGTYAGAVTREFVSEASSGVVVTTETPAVVKVNLGALAKYPGYYSANDGFLDDAVYIQDSRYYQVFSYVLRIDERLASYKTAVKTMVHPAGTALFGEYEISNNFDISVSLESLVKSLALSLRDTFTFIDTGVLLQISKYLSEEQFIDESLVKNIGKSLDDSIDTPTDSMVRDIGKSLDDSIDTPTDFITTKDIGKSLEDALSTPTDAITVKDIGKALSDSSTPSDSITSKDMTKYLEDTETMSGADDGYVAKNPYSEGGYFSIHPIIYDNTVDSKFGSTVDTNNYT